MAACQLIRHRVRGVAGSQRMLVPLHAESAACDELIPLCRAIAPDAAICAPQAPRCLDPVFSSRPAGLEREGRGIAGFAWFRCDAGTVGGGTIDPASFGDSLWQVEQLVAELRAEGCERIFIVGRCEGALLGLAARRSLGALLAGVVALGSSEAELPSWASEAPAADLAPLLELPDASGDRIAPRVAHWLASIDAPAAKPRCDGAPGPAEGGLERARPSAESRRRASGDPSNR